MSEPKRYTYDDFIGELLSISNDAQNCAYRLGSERIRRIDILDRLTLILVTGKDKIVPAFRDAAQKLDGARNGVRK